MLKIIDRIVEISPTHKERRLIITRDELQWIVMIGHPKYNDKQMLQASNKSYYSRLDYLLTDLLIQNYRASLDDLKLPDVLVTIEKSFQDIKALGLELEHNLKGLLHETS